MRGLQWSDNLSDAYFIALVDIPETLLSWVTRHIAGTFESKDFRPEPGDIRGMIYERIAPCPSLEDALAEVCDVASRHGRFARKIEGRNVWIEGDPTFSHSIVGQVIDSMGGWQQFVANEKSDPATMRAQFRDLYNSLRRDRRRRGQSYISRPTNEWPADVLEKWVKPKQLTAPPPVVRNEEAVMTGPPMEFQELMSRLVAGAK